jgi:hypothetical protein
MARTRRGETWQRSQEPTNGSPQSERLTAQILLFDRYEDVNPSHPLGGANGRKDILCTRDGLRGWGSRVLSEGTTRFRNDQEQLTDDLRKVNQESPFGRFLFVRNHELRLTERRESGAAAVGLGGPRRGRARGRSGARRRLIYERLNPAVVVLVMRGRAGRDW